MWFVHGMLLSADLSTHLTEALAVHLLDLLVHLVVIHMEEWVRLDSQTCCNFPLYS
jgi:hypothetical protein